MTRFWGQVKLTVEPGGWLVVRLDGRGFHQFTKRRFDKPFDEQFRDLMVATVRVLMEELHALYAFSMSDEISLLMPTDWNLFGCRVEKIVSVTASLASATFVPKALRWRTPTSPLLLSVSWWL